MKKMTPLTLLIHAVMFLLALTWLYPFIWMVISSLKPTAQIYTTGLFSGHLTLENYAFLFDNSNRADKPFCAPWLTRCSCRSPLPSASR